MKTFLLLAGLLAATSIQAEPADPVSGKRLFEASRCLECHATDVFTKETRKVKSFAALESQVRRCDANLSANWFDDQVLDVVAYLNQAFYKFPLPGAGASANSSPVPPPAHPASPANPPANAGAIATIRADMPADTQVGENLDAKTN